MWIGTPIHGGKVSLLRGTSDIFAQSAPGIELATLQLPGGLMWLSFVRKTKTNSKLLSLVDLTWYDPAPMVVSWPQKTPLLDSFSLKNLSRLLVSDSKCSSVSTRPIWPHKTKFKFISVSVVDLVNIFVSTGLFWSMYFYHVVACRGTSFWLRVAEMVRLRRFKVDESWSLHSCQHSRSTWQGRDFNADLIRIKSKPILFLPSVNLIEPWSGFSR